MPVTTSTPTDGPRVVSVNVGRAAPHPTSPRRSTGIDKQPVDQVDVHDPGPRESGGGSGVAGDFIGDGRHHGGSDQAVYLFAAEELAHWERELGRDLAPGSFGENVTTAGLDVDALPLGTRLRIGGAVLLTCGPRIPCGTFAGHLAETGWTRRFAEHGRSGVYCAVLEPGTIRPGDPVHLEHSPDHGVDTTSAFRAQMGDLAAADRVLASGALSAHRHAELAAKVAARRR